MSHVVSLDLEIHDLAALEAACKRIGLELRRNQKTYRWWGRSAGDYPLPQGFTADELGSCEHAIGIPNDTETHRCYAPGASIGVGMIPGAYEVGVVRRRDGRPGWTMLWDFYDGGYGLEAVVGENCSKLKQAYGVEVAKRKAIQQGFRVQERKLPNGSVQLVCSR